MQSLKLTPSQLRLLLTAAIQQSVKTGKRINILITGSPGIGKTSVVRSVAQELGADLLVSTPSTEDPTEPKGFPWAEAGQPNAHFKPFGNLAKALAATKLTIWFLDDLGQAADAVQAGYMPLLQGYTADGQKLPNVVVFVAATNRRTDRAKVSGLLEPVKSRFATIVELVPDLDEWGDWYLTQQDVAPEVLAYLRWQPDALNQFQASADLVNSPQPRTWEAAGRILPLDLPPAVEATSICGAIGEGQGGQLLAFVEMYRQLPSIDGILMDPDNAPIPENKPSVLYAVATGVASRVNPKNFKQAAKYAVRLEDAGFGDFAALLITDCTRRDSDLQTTPDFVRVMAGPLGQLIGSGA